MPGHSTASRLAKEAGTAIRRGFERFQNEFRAITRRAPRRFARRDWHGMQGDSAERLDVYEAVVERVVAEIEKLLAPRLRDRLVWISAKAVYSALIHDRDDWEIAETFFNSVTRRVFTTVGVDNEMEFVHTDYESPPTAARHPIYETFPPADSLAGLFTAIFAASGLPLDRGACCRAAEMASFQLCRRETRSVRETDRVEMVRSVLYRGAYAFLIGRVHTEAELLPLVFCFRHGAGGVELDNVLTTADEVSLLFSFARNYFHVDVERPYDLVRFIKSIIPRKPTAEVYISLGYNKHGKTELYRHALRHLAGSSDKYQLAEGQRGMVMVVFTMPSYPVVFKIIKDRFDYPKDCTREEVIDRYRLVFRHDRAGRLIDAQEYKYLVLDRRRFEDELVDELLRIAAQTVSADDDRVVIKHCYAERRVTPLNVYLQEADERAAASAVIDYGQAIKDLAVTNIFPGDLLLKNFGVTRQRRVVSYDYDEVCLLTECTFREFPQGGDYDEEMAAEPWYGVGRRDVFPEEFAYFLGLPPALREVFEKHHRELFDTGYWNGLKRRLQAGELFHVAPYRTWGSRGEG
jgi:isocitrate dehydrogenase kinase/phosphatase